ncbi:MAG TPA: hypothetical protein VIM75_18695 [Ohtaekwangia sp.]|uniref:hypothetical protein n=1 Tax=Ohtaekwangia sp. TaxID=2066019 RepID=UPI002F956A3D
MNPTDKKNEKQILFTSDSQSQEERLDEVLHSKLPELEAFITTIRDSEINLKSDYDRDGGHDRTYDRDADSYDRGTFDRTH